MRIRRLLEELLFILVLAPLVGAAAGLSGVVLGKMLVFLHEVFFRPGVPVVAAPIVGALLAGPLVAWLAPEARGGGVVAVIRQLVLRGGRIPPLVAPVKLVASALCIGSGGSGGREGPIVQVGAAVGSLLGQAVSLTAARRRLLLACGAAAGIAATFDTPLGAVFFGLEVILGHYGARYFSAIVMSSVTSSVIVRYFFGRFPAFQVPEYGQIPPHELPLYLLLGLLCAIWGELYIRSMAGCQKALARVPLWVRPACGAVAVGLLGLLSLRVPLEAGPLPPVMGDGFWVINLMLAARLGLGVALALMALKLVATAATLGSDSSAGLYGPGLFMGAALGSAFGAVVHRFTVAPPGLFALVGMGALSASVAQAPLSSIIMLFELSGNYRMLPPIMAAAILATLVGRAFSPNSVFTHSLSEQGIDIWRFRGGDLLSSLPVASAVLRDAPLARPEEDCAEVLGRLDRCGLTACPVLDDAGRLLGMVGQAALQQGGGVSAALTRDFPVTWPDETLREAALKLDEVPFDVLPVVARSSCRELLGVLTARGILIAYHRLLDEVDTLEGGLVGVRGSEHLRLVGGERYGIPLPGGGEESPGSGPDNFRLLSGE